MDWSFSSPDNRAPPSSPDPGLSTESNDHNGLISPKVWDKIGALVAYAHSTENVYAATSQNLASKGPDIRRDDYGRSDDSLSPSKPMRSSAPSSSASQKRHSVLDGPLHLHELDYTQPQEFFVGRVQIPETDFDPCEFQDLFDDLYPYGPNGIFPFNLGQEALDFRAEPSWQVYLADKLPDVDPEPSSSRLASPAQSSPQIGAVGQPQNPAPDTQHPQAGIPQTTQAGQQQIEMVQSVQIQAQIQQAQMQQSQMRQARARMEVQARAQIHETQMQRARDLGRQLHRQLLQQQQAYMQQAQAQAQMQQAQSSQAWQQQRTPQQQPLLQQSQQQMMHQYGQLQPVPALPHMLNPSNIEATSNNRFFPAQQTMAQPVSMHPQPSSLNFAPSSVLHAPSFGGYGQNLPGLPQAGLSQQDLSSFPEASYYGGYGQPPPGLSQAGLSQQDLSSFPGAPSYGGYGQPPPGLFQAGHSQQAIQQMQAQVRSSRQRGAPQLGTNEQRVQQDFQNQVRQAAQQAQQAQSIPPQSQHGLTGRPEATQPQLQRAQYLHDRLRRAQQTHQARLARHAPQGQPEPHPDAAEYASFMQSTNDMGIRVRAMRELTPVPLTQINDCFREWVDRHSNVFAPGPGRCLIRKV